MIRYSTNSDDEREINHHGRAVTIGDDENNHEDRNITHVDRDIQREHIAMPWSYEGKKAGFREEGCQMSRPPNTARRKKDLPIFILA